MLIELPVVGVLRADFIEFEIGFLEVKVTVANGIWAECLARYQLMNHFFILWTAAVLVVMQTSSTALVIEGGVTLADA